MVFKQFTSFFFNSIATRQQQRIKDRTLSESKKLDALIRAKEDSVRSLGLNSSSSEVLGVESEICCICLSMMGGGDIRALPCKHKFHRECISGWFNARQTTCPVCRFGMGEKERCDKGEEQMTEEMVIWFSSFHVAD